MGAARTLLVFHEINCAHDTLSIIAVTFIRRNVVGTLGFGEAASSESNASFLGYYLSKYFYKTLGSNYAT